MPKKDWTKEWAYRYAAMATLQYKKWYESKTGQWDRRRTVKG